MREGGIREGGGRKRRVKREASREKYGESDRETERQKTRPPSQRARPTLQEADERGEDYARVKAMGMTVEEQDIRERLAKKKNPDGGFAGV